MLNAVKKYFQPDPDPEAVAWHRQAVMTPDVPQLFQFKRQHVFVADNVHDDVLQNWSWNGEPIHPTCYTHHEYTLWKKDLGTKSYSIILPSNYRPSGFTLVPVEPGKIRGSLWNVSPYAIISLDKAKVNGVQFVRTRVPIDYNYRTVCYDDKHVLPKISGHNYFQMQDAYMYIGNPEYWDPMIGGIFASAQLDTHEHFPPRTWMKKFYQLE